MHSTACHLGSHRDCSMDACDCYCHQGKTRPGVPPPDAPHFVEHDLVEGVNTAVKRAIVRGLSKQVIGQSVWKVMTDLGFEAVVKWPDSARSIPPSPAPPADPASLEAPRRRRKTR